ESITREGIGTKAYAQREGIAVSSLYYWRQRLKAQCHGPQLPTQINLYYPPEPGRTRARVVPIEVTSRGRLNLHQFDPRLQAQLERYLVRIGILRPGQTLSTHEAPLTAGPVGATTPEGA